MKNNKIFLIQVLDAYIVFKTLVTLRYSDFEVSYKISKAFKELQEKAKFYSEEERKLINAYAKKDENGKVIIRDGNTIDFDSNENSEKYISEIAKLQGTSIDIFDPIEIDIKDFKNNKVELTPLELLSVENLIKIKMEEK